MIAHNSKEKLCSDTLHDNRRRESYSERVSVREREKGQRNTKREIVKRKERRKERERRKKKKVKIEKEGGRS